MKYYLILKLNKDKEVPMFHSPEDVYVAADEFSKLFNIDFTIPLVKYKSTEMLYTIPINVENKEDFTYLFIKYPFFEFLTLEELLERRGYGRTRPI